MKKSKNVLLSILIISIVLGSLFIPKEVEAVNHIYKTVEEVKFQDRPVKLFVGKANSIGEKVDIPKEMGEIFLDEAGRTLVPIRFISEYMGHKVDWDKKDYVATIDEKIAIKIGEEVISVKDGENFKMDTKAIIADGRTYLPLRFVSEVLKYDVGYEKTKDAHMVFINEIFERPVEPDYPNGGETGDDKFIIRGGDKNGKIKVELVEGDFPIEKYGYKPIFEFGINPSGLELQLVGLRNMKDGVEFKGSTTYTGKWKAYNEYYYEGNVSGKPITPENTIYRYHNIAGYSQVVYLNDATVDKMYRIENNKKVFDYPQMEEGDVLTFNTTFSNDDFKAVYKISVELH